MAEARRGWADALRHWSPLIGAWLVPVLAWAGVVLLAADREGGAVGAAPSATVQIGTRSTDFRQAVQVDVVLAEQVEVLSPVSGLVTGVTFESGPVPEQGAVAFTVDGVRVLVHRGDAPFHRELRPADKGPDVRALGALLVSLGHLDPSDADSSFGSATARAVRGLQRDLGAPQTGVFSPAYLLFVPGALTGDLTPAISVGDRVEAGAVIAAGSQPPVSVTVAVTAGGPVEALAQGPAVIRVGAASAPISAVTSTGDAASELFDVLSTMVADGELAAPSQAEGGALRFEGLTAETASPVVVGTIPGTALHASTDGTFCVFAAAGASDSPTYTAVRVDAPAAVRGEIGLVAVPAELAGTRVASTAADVPAEVLATCG